MVRKPNHLEKQEEIIPEDEDEENEIDDLLYDPEQINIVTREPTIEQLLRRIDEQALDLAPDFQRHANLWKDDAKSRLIESVIIRIPLPAFYIDATNEDQWLVIDGLQRLFALKQFVIDKKLKLSGLEYLKTLVGKTYDQLERRYQRRIEETQVTVYLIEKGTPPAVKYNIFKRINRGGLPLSPQELRHALNPGKGTFLLAELANSEEFTRVVQLSNEKKMRMEDREFILGFLAFILIPYQTYKGSKRNLFLSRALAKINRMEDIEIEEIKYKFRRTMIAAWNIFNQQAFRKISKNNLNNSRNNPLNEALFESWSFNLSELNDQQIEILTKSKQDLIQKFAERIDSDTRFEKSISQVRYHVEYRFSTIADIIQEVLL
ncbi:MAG: DUF262 domain-containing protein [Planktothrix sp.]|uniref:DUF262 domain-containing protein n=2 Tax=Planktothrix sp. TaxID=3088171 RepID=UPI0038D41D12